MRPSLERMCSCGPVSQGAGPCRGAAAEQSAPESASEDLEGSPESGVIGSRGRAKMLVFTLPFLAQSLHSYGPR